MFYSEKLHQLGAESGISHQLGDELEKSREPVGISTYELSKVLPKTSEIEFAINTTKIDS